MTAKTCFVIGPIGAVGSAARKRSDQILKYLIAPVVEPLGYTVLRADQIPEPGLITSQVVDHVLNDTLVIADLTNRNANVFYELALRHAIAKSVVHLVDRLDGIPFDVAGMRTLPVAINDPDALNDAMRELERQVQEIERPGWTMATPVSRAVEAGLFRRRDDARTRVVGCRLFQYKGLYPVDLASRTNEPSLNHDVFYAAIDYFLRVKDDRLAAMDLVYLREDNRRAGLEVLRPDDLEAYETLITKYSLDDFRRNFASDIDRLFRNVIRIVHDVGATLRGIKCEFVLHDVRNPLRSIIALSNADEVSNRYLHGPSTRFVVQYLKHQGKDLIALEHRTQIAYPKQFLKSKRVKATTTPLYDDELGLIGLLCLNIDVDAVNAMTADERQRFFVTYTKTFGCTPEYEREDAPELGKPRCADRAHVSAQGDRRSAKALNRVRLDRGSRKR